MSNTQSTDAVTIPWWWRPAFCAAVIIAGLASIGVGVQVAAWFFTGETHIETRVWCDDDNEYAYEEGEYLAVEHYRDEYSAYCQRTTEEVGVPITSGWSLWLAVPVWIGAFAGFVALIPGGGAGAGILVWEACTEENRKMLLERRRTQLQKKQRR